MTLPAFAAERRRRVPAVDRYLLQAPALSSKPAADAVDRRDRQTDGGHPVYMHTVRAASTTKL